MAKTKTDTPNLVQAMLFGNQSRPKKNTVNTQPSLTEVDMAYTVQELFWKMARNESLDHLKKVSSFPIDVDHSIEDYEKLLGMDLVDEMAIKAKVDGYIARAKREIERIQEENNQSKQGVAYRDKNGNLITKEEWLKQNPQEPLDPPPVE